MDIGKRIKARRKELGLSAEQVAELMGVSPATVYRYESNYITNMRVDKLTPIAKALNTTEAYLLGWTNDINQNQNSSQYRMTYYLKALEKDHAIKALFDLVSDLNSEQSMRVFDLLTDYLSCDEYSQGRISNYANMLAFGYADTKNIDAGIDQENMQFKSRFTKRLSEKDVDIEPSGPHPYRGPDEDLVRAVAEKDTSKTLEDLKEEVKTKNAARKAEELEKGRPAK